MKQNSEFEEKYNKLKHNVGKINKMLNTTRRDIKEVSKTNIEQFKKEELFNQIIDIEKENNRNKNINKKLNSKKLKRIKTSKDTEAINLKNSNFRPQLDTNQPNLDYNKTFYNDLINEIYLTKTILNKQKDILVKLNRIAEKQFEFNNNRSMRSFIESNLDFKEKAQMYFNLHIQFKKSYSVNFVIHDDWVNIIKTMINKHIYHQIFKISSIRYKNQIYEEKQHLLKNQNFKSDSKDANQKMVYVMQDLKSYQDKNKIIIKETNKIYEKWERKQNRIIEDTKTICELVGRSYDNLEENQIKLMNQSQQVQNNNLRIDQLMTKEDFLNEKIDYFKYKNINISHKIDESHQNKIEILNYKIQKIKDQIEIVREEHKEQQNSIDNLKKSKIDVGDKQIRLKEKIDEIDFMNINLLGLQRDLKIESDKLIHKKSKVNNLTKTIDNKIEEMSKHKSKIVEQQSITILTLVKLEDMKIHNEKIEANQKAINQIQKKEELQKEIAEKYVKFKLNIEEKNKFGDVLLFELMINMISQSNQWKVLGFAHELSSIELHEQLANFFSLDPESNQKLLNWILRPKYKIQNVNIHPSIDKFSLLARIMNLVSLNNFRFYQPAFNQDEEYKTVIQVKSQLDRYHNDIKMDLNSYCIGRKVALDHNKIEIEILIDLLKSDRHRFSNEQIAYLSLMNYVYNKQQIGLNSIDSAIWCEQKGFLEFAGNNQRMIELLQNLNRRRQKYLEQIQQSNNLEFNLMQDTNLSMISDIKVDDDELLMDEEDTERLIYLKQQVDEIQSKDYVEDNQDQ